VWKPDRTDKRKGKNQGKEKEKNQRGWTDCRHATWVGTVGCATGTRAWVQVDSGRYIYIYIYIWERNRWKSPTCANYLFSKKNPPQSQVARPAGPFAAAAGTPWSSLPAKPQAPTMPGCTLNLYPQIQPWAYTS
jgi:hypothetical protein